MTDADRDPVVEAAERRLADTQAALRRIDDSLARIERDRRRIRPGDWETMFRQMRTLFLELASHPFLAGDAHAEMLLTRMVHSPDLEEFDRRVSTLGEYVAGKLAYNAALRAAREGREPDPAEIRPRTFGATAPGAGRVAAQFGPSGSDFPMADEPEPTRARRGILKL